MRPCCRSKNSYKLYHCITKSMENAEDRCIHIGKEIFSFIVLPCFDLGLTVPMYIQICTFYSNMYVHMPQYMYGQTHPNVNQS